MDYNHIRKIHDYVYSTPPNSAERMARLAELNEADSKALFDFDVALRSGSISELRANEQEEQGNMTFKEYKKLAKSKWQLDFQKIMMFEAEYPCIAADYKKRLSAEKSKLAEIASIKDRSKRREAIAENIKLFEW